MSDRVEWLRLAMGGHRGSLDARYTKYRDELVKFAFQLARHRRVQSFRGDQCDNRCDQRRRPTRQLSTRQLFGHRDRSR